MKLRKTIIGGMTMVLLSSTSLTTTFAMEGMDSSMGHDGMAGMEMATDSHGASIMLDSDIQEGVKALAHLKDIKEAMAEHGGTMTHHFMVEFSVEGTTDKLDTGLAALKIIDPEGQALSPKKMMAMDGSFGVDIELTKNGKYMFEVGTKLSDGKKRIFRFHYEK